MSQSVSRSHFVAFFAGIGLTALTALLMGQGASQPVKSEAQYFVTADGDEAHLWVREGTTIRVVGHGACKECAEKGHDHKEGDGHNHTKPAPKK